MLLALKVRSRGYKRAREGHVPSLWWKRVNGCRELGCCSAVCLCCVLVGSRFDGFVMVRSGLAWIDVMPFVGRPAFPFIGQEKARVTAEGKKRTRESQRPSGSPGPSYPSCGSRRPCRCQQGRLHVMALFVTGAVRRRRLPVMALHSVPADVVVS